MPFKNPPGNVRHCLPSFSRDAHCIRISSSFFSQMAALSRTSKSALSSLNAASHFCLLVSWSLLCRISSWQMRFSLFETYEIRNASERGQTNRHTLHRWSPTTVSRRHLSTIGRNFLGACNACPCGWDTWEALTGVLTGLRGEGATLYGDEKRPWRHPWRVTTRAFRTCRCACCKSFSHCASISANRFLRLDISYLSQGQHAVISQRQT